nr:immunoglobulin heavy chain junction region [Macaca mulatta]
CATKWGDYRNSLDSG